MRDYEVVVVGGGLAGLTAGLFAARHGRSTLVLEPSIPGGHLVNIGKIEDFPGFPASVAGYDLGPMLQEQAANEGADFELAEVSSLARLEAGWLVSTADASYRARVVIFAAGSRPRELGVPGEERLRGKGISHCASCDGPLYRGKPLAVVGGGDSALQEALTLADFASEVVLLHRGATFTAQQVYQRRVAESATIAVRANTVVDEILGDDAVSGLRLRNSATGDHAERAVAGVFIYIGLEPNTACLPSTLRLDESGHIPTDIWMRTELPGLFAAGDIRADSASQAVTAAGDGATAAIAAHRFIESGSWPGR